ncbi:MAG: rhomboid family intramembrane serine protease [Chloroflexota bacterium]
MNGDYSPQNNIPAPPADSISTPTQPRSVLVRFQGVKPNVTFTLIGLTVLIFVLQSASDYLLGYDIPAGLGVKDNAGILAGELWRLFTPMLLHGSVLHILFNMYALYSLGPSLEAHYGHRRFLALYVLAGFAGNVVSFIFSPQPSLGSSTAIFGLLGAYGVFAYQNRRIFGKQARSTLTNVIVIALINLVIGMAPMIDNWGHVGGLAGGTLFAWLAGPILQPEGVFPDLRLVNQRTRAGVLRAGVVTGGLFGLLALLTILYRLMFPG